MKEILVQISWWILDTRDTTLLKSSSRKEKFVLARAIIANILQ